MGQLKQAFDDYREHQVELVATYIGNLIVIKDGQVLGAYDAELPAVEEAAKEHELGSFPVRR